MSQHRASENGSSEGRPWRSQPVSRHAAGARVHRSGGGTRRAGSGPRPEQPRRPEPGRRQSDRPQPPPALGRPLGPTAPLTAFGVSLVLVGSCLAGGALDLLLVGTAAWCLIGLFLIASVYAAAKVRRSDWYSAVVGPPLAFACGLTLVAAFSPHDMSTGLLGTLATMLELLAYKARTVFFGTALAVCVTLVRKLPFRR